MILRPELVFLLGIGFLLVSFAYSRAGFGGGSSYSALLVMASVDYRLVPLISLSCNSAVTINNLFRHPPPGFLENRVPWVLYGFSIPAAFIGGSLLLDKASFSLLLGLLLAVAGIRQGFQWWYSAQKNLPLVQQIQSTSIFLWALIGSLIGLSGGAAGIGGGILLSPVLHRMGYHPQTIIRTSSYFIAYNSLAGILGQLSKGAVMAAEYLPLLGMVMVVVLLGSSLGTRSSGQHGTFYRVLAPLSSILLLSVSWRLIF